MMIISRDKSLLCPAFVVRLNEFERRLAIDHLPFYLYEGFRTFEVSDEYYAQGRSKPGPLCVHDGIARPMGTCSIHPLGLIITNARGGDSLHNYGLGADYILDSDTVRPGVQWSWDNRGGIFETMGKVAEDCGLIWGGDWKRFPDLPHLEMPGLTLSEIKEIYRQSNGDLKVLWAHYKNT